MALESVRLNRILFPGPLEYVAHMLVKKGVDVAGLPEIIVNRPTL